MNAYIALTEILVDNKYARSSGANQWGLETWSRKGCPSVRVHVDRGSVEAERVMVQIQHDIEAASMKRPPKTFRKRATAAKKNAAVEKRLREIEARIAERNRELGGMQEFLTGPEARLIRQKIEDDEREMREIRKLMSSIPGPRADAGRPRAKHRS